MSTGVFKERLRGFGISFEQSLDDLIKGIRACQGDNEKLGVFFDKSITECRQELKSNDLQMKSTAILKLAYLEMYGFDMSWCNFNILEVMASPKFQHKRIGYLAAIQILQRQNNDDALMLMTNLLKKDLNSVHFVETSLAISGIAAVVSKDLAIDIVDDMAKMLTHSKPIIRKKAVLAIYKVLLAYPEALRQYYDRIVDRLNDDDPSVVSATVNVVCELAHGNAGNYVALIPTLFGLLKMTENNWMVIRLLKLFAHLSLTEPRLKGKLLPEIMELMSNSKSLSICYECINSILDGDMLSPADLKTAESMIKRLIVFFESNDLNLRYVGLLALIKICKIHKDLIKNHDKILLTCIYDDDITIRETSLDIINPLVTEANIVTIVTRLIVQLIPYSEQKERLLEINKSLSANEEDQFGRHQKPIIVSDKYKFMIIEKIIEICSMKNYDNIPNFKWYLSVLIDIIHLNEDNKIQGSDVLISEQFIDMSIRVPSIRPALVKACIELTSLENVTYDQLLFFKNGLKDCIWIIGEYYLDYIKVENDDSDEESDEESSIQDMKEEKHSAIEIFDVISHQDYLKSLGNSTMDPIIPGYIHSIAKLYNKFIVSITANGATWSKDQFEVALNLANKIIIWFDEFSNACNILTQERALGYSEILKLVVETLNTSLSLMEDDGLVSPPGFLIYGYRKLFESYEIKPMNKSFQGRVSIPNDLDLENDFNEGKGEFWEVYDEIIKEQNGKKKFEKDIEMFESSDEDVTQVDTTVDTDLEIKEREKERQEALRDDPYYIFGDDKISAPVKSSEMDSIAEKKKKVKKPKKIKKEKVLVIGDEEEDQEKKGDDENKVLSSSKFVIDSSKLAKIDLTKNEDEGSNALDVYQVEPVIPIEVSLNKLSIEQQPLVVKEPIKRKPKKVKKKKAVIE